jgi:phage tail P2-like protein
MIGPNLLPVGSGRAEHALADGVLAAFAFPVPVRHMWNPATCPAHLLPWLAFALSVDDWDPLWSDPVKRAVLAASFEVHRRKGTIAGMKLALDAAGYGDSTIVEAKDLPRLGAPAPAGQGMPLGRGWRLGYINVLWADYWVQVNQPIDRRSADDLAKRLRAVAPARCRLRRIYMASGVQFLLGSGVWTLGNNVPLGGVYNYEVIENG